MDARHWLIGFVNALALGLAILNYTPSSAEEKALTTVTPTPAAARQAGGDETLTYVKFEMENGLTPRNLTPVVLQSPR
jgi:hypothetical protein